MLGVNGPLRVHSHQAKANLKEKIFFDVWIFSLISSECSLILLAFAFAFIRCKQALNIGRDVNVGVDANADVECEKSFDYLSNHAGRVESHFQSHQHKKFRTHPEPHHDPQHILLFWFPLLLGPNRHQDLNIIISYNSSIEVNWGVNFKVSTISSLLHIHTVLH